MNELIGLLNKLDPIEKYIITDGLAMRQEGRSAKRVCAWVHGNIEHYHAALNKDAPK